MLRGETLGDEMFHLFSEVFRSWSIVHQGSSTIVLLPPDVSRKGSDDYFV